MDENPYANLRGLVDQNNSMTNKYTASLEELNRKTENYNIADKLSQEGISLKDLISRIDTLQKKVDNLEKPTQAFDEDLFRMMEASVKDDPLVIEAKRKVKDEKDRVMAEICARDQGFMTARDEYRRTVNKVYIARKEYGGQTEQARLEESGKADRKEVRDKPKRRENVEKSVEVHEEPAEPTE